MAFDYMSALGRMPAGLPTGTPTGLPNTQVQTALPPVSAPPPGTPAGPFPAPSGMMPPGLQDTLNAKLGGLPMNYGSMFQNLGGAAGFPGFLGGMFGGGQGGGQGGGFLGGLMNRQPGTNIFGQPKAPNDAKMAAYGKTPVDKTGLATPKTTPY